MYSFLRGLPDTAATQRAFQTMGILYFNRQALPVGIPAAMPSVITKNPAEADTPPVTAVQ